MKKLQSKIVLILILTLLAGIRVNAQDNYTFYNLSQVPQRHYLNPSFMPQQRAYYGVFPLTLPLMPTFPIPVFSNNYISKGNNGPRLIDFLKKEGDSTVIDLDKAISKSAAINTIRFNTNIDLLNFGFQVKKNYFTFNLTNKALVSFSYPKDFLTLLNEGNGGANIGKELNFKFAINANLYNELGLGYMREVKENKLWLGGKLKVYQGLGNIQTKKNDAILLTGDTAYELTTKADILINTGGIITQFFDTTAAKEIEDNPTASILSFNNLGFGLDLGATYKLNEKITLSASVIDLGYINYKQYARNYALTGNYKFSGVDFAQVVNDSSGLENAFNEISDSIAGAFKPSTTYNSYNVIMPAQVYLQGSYAFAKILKAGGLFHTQFYDSKPHFGGSVSLTAQVKNWLNVSTSYSVYNRSAGNIGLGIGFNFGMCQTYLVTDNILAFTSYSYFGNSQSGQAPVKIPTGYRNLNLRIGANWTFGRKPKDNDKDGVDNKKDACPDEKGLKEFNGCPDKDNDKIADKDDKCPDVAGLATLNGCPDTDADGVTDMEDSCPNEAGPAETKGCPDKDKDGVNDSKDECPDVAGLPELKGCPDKDKDGITDEKDACPEKRGTAEGEGCPDTDGDGIYDHKDLCPEQAGPADNKGCPWKDTDGDGVLDKDDKCIDQAGPADNKGCPSGDKDGDGIKDNEDECPNTAGPASNKGCPELKKEEQEVLNTAFNNLEFETGKDVILSTSFEELNALAELLKKKQDWKLKIDGHTDNKGDAKKNMELSKNRAIAVAKYLNSKGIDSSRLISNGFGSTKPIANNATEDGRKHNRRVEMKVIFE